LKERYFAWTQESEEALKELVYRGGLSWIQIAGRISAAFGQGITGSSARAKHDRLMQAQKGKRTRAARQGDPLMRNPPPGIKQDIIKREVNQDFPFSEIFMVPYPPTPEKEEIARREHWRELVDYLAERALVSRFSTLGVKPFTWMRRRGGITRRMRRLTPTLRGFAPLLLNLSAIS